MGLGAAHSSPRSLGFGDGHWGAVRARTPGRDPPRGPSGQPCPGGSQGGSPVLEDPHCPARRGCGARTLVDSGNLADACDRSPALCTVIRGCTHTHTHTQVHAHTRPPATHSQAQAGDRAANSCPGRQGCEWSFHPSPPGSPAGFLVQPLLPDWGPARLSGPPPAPAAWPGPLSLWVPAPGVASSALCKAGPSVSSKPILEGRSARCTCPPPRPSLCPSVDAVGFKPRCCTPASLLD